MVMVVITQFSYDPERNMIVHLLTNRIVSVTKNLVGPNQKKCGIRMIRALNSKTDLTFSAKEDINVSFILEAIQWYIGYKDLEDLEICGL